MFSLLCNNICHMSRYAERSHKSEKKDNSLHKLGPPVITIELI